MTWWQVLLLVAAAAVVLFLLGIAIAVPHELGADDPPVGPRNPEDPQW